LGGVLRLIIAFKRQNNYERMMILMRRITNESITNFKERLIEEEKSPATVDKYVRDVTLFMAWCNNARLCKALVLEYKQMAVEKYAPASVNAIISSLNSFLHL
jgi:site-specific recombinase XerD